MEIVLVPIIAILVMIHTMRNESAGIEKIMNKILGKEREQPAPIENYLEGKTIKERIKIYASILISLILSLAISLLVAVLMLAAMKRKR